MCLRICHSWIVGELWSAFIYRIQFFFNLVYVVYQYISYFRNVLEKYNSLKVEELNMLSLREKCMSLLE